MVNWEEPKAVAWTISRDYKVQTREEFWWDWQEPRIWYKSKLVFFQHSWQWLVSCQELRAVLLHQWSSWFTGLPPWTLSRPFSSLSKICTQATVATQDDATWIKHCLIYFDSPSNRIDSLVITMENKRMLGLGKTLSILQTHISVLNEI